jgi:hypothetical protein
MVNQKEAWFLEGAAALRTTLSRMELDHLLPATGDYYACPCCLTAYGYTALSGGLLTYEHVPPKANGGKPLVLTCKDCNNTAGSALDADAARREALHDLLTARSSRRGLRAEFDVDGITTRGTVSRAGDAFMLSVVPKANNPSDVARSVAALEERIAQNSAGGRIGFQVTETFSIDRARLSWVRAAYLAAFGALGWRYAFQKHLNPLRDALKDPIGSPFPPISLVDPGADQTRRQLFFVEEPTKLRSLVVTLGPHTVFLPDPSEPRPFEDISAILEELSQAPSPPHQFTGKEIPWPTKPEYALDRNESEGQPSES